MKAAGTESESMLALSLHIWQLRRVNVEQHADEIERVDPDG